MYRNLKKLSLAMVAALALVALGTTTFHSPTGAQEPGGGPLACAEGQGAFFSDTNTWECGDIIPPDKIAFVTVTVTDGDFSGTVDIGGSAVGAGLFGLDWADAICQAEAEAAFGIDPSRTFLPWVSILRSDRSEISPTLRPAFTKTSSTILTASLSSITPPIAHGWEELTVRPAIWSSISFAADGTSPGSGGVFRLVWTNTTRAGEAASGFDCQDWASASEGDIGVVGTRAQSSIWSKGKTDPDGTTEEAQESCATVLPFYCFEQ